ncbi:MAG: ATP-binding protein [Undibacterium sp.]|nr:ATP-binding protein [Undibacterium sp.]
MKNFSLRKRISLMVMLSLLVVWSITAVVSYRESREEINELFDTQLEQCARIILLLDLKRMQRLVDGENNGEGSVQVIREQDKELDHEQDHDQKVAALPFQVWDADGRLLLHTASAPHVSFLAGSGFDTITDENKTWRSMALWNQHKGFQVRVFEDARQRTHLAGSITWRMLMPLLIALPGLVLLIWLSIGRGLQPLQAMSAAIAARGADKLDQIELDKVPVEVQSVVTSLNDLLQRLSHSMDQERRFTADAAHELRTPLAAIQVQAEVALAAQDRQQQDQAMRGIIEGIKHTTRLSEQLLMLARLDHVKPESQQSIDLSELARRCAAVHANSALEKDIELSVNAMDAVTLRGDPVLLEVMLGNLIDNAIRYTHAQGNIDIDISKQGAQIVLSVKDDGPGLSDTDKARAADRFYRGEGNGSSGSGLGLSIVERIAQVHGAKVLLEQGLRGKGLGVSVLFFK